MFQSLLIIFRKRPKFRFRSLQFGVRLVLAGSVRPKFAEIFSIQFHAHLQYTGASGNGPRAKLFLTYLYIICYPCPACNHHYNCTCMFQEECFHSFDHMETGLHCIHQHLKVKLTYTRDWMEDKKLNKLKHNADLQWTVACTVQNPSYMRSFTAYR